MLIPRLSAFLHKPLPTLDQARSGQKLGQSKSIFFVASGMQRVPSHLSMAPLPTIPLLDTSRPSSDPVRVWRTSLTPARSEDKPNSDFQPDRDCPQDEEACPPRGP